MRVEAKPLTAYPWYLRPFFWHQRRRYGQVLQPALLWARVPRFFLGMAWMAGALKRRGSRVSPALRAVLSVRVAQIEWCRFCVDLNAAMGIEGGLDDAKLAALEDWRSSELFDARERAALAYAEAMTRPGGVDEGAAAELKRHFDDDAVVEITGLIAVQVMSSKFNAALDVPAQGFCRVPLSAAPASTGGGGAGD